MTKPVFKSPLPFVGNKFRWHKALYPLIDSLPQHAIVFDAFGGCFAVSRMIKDRRPDIVCIVNDCQMYFRKRLEVVRDTNAVLDEMRINGAYKGPHDRYVRYDSETEKRLVEICAKGIDQTTCRVNLYTDDVKTIRAKCSTVNYDENQCDNWCSDCVIIDELLDESKAKYYARSCDLIVLDPPYLVSPKQWGCGDYIQETQKARSFCKAIIESGCNCWLFDGVKSNLLQLVKDIGWMNIPYPGKVNRQGAKEELWISNPTETPKPIETIQPVHEWECKQLSLF